MKRRYNYLAVIILLWSLTLSNPNSLGQSLELDVEITEGGTVLSLNITSIEFDKSLDQKTHIVNIADGRLSSIWSDVDSTDATAFGTNGQIASVYGIADVFFLFTHDVDIDWISLQWDNSQSYTPAEMGEREMQTGDDMWVFGLTEKVTVLGDAIAHGTEETFLKEDLQEDLEWERLVINDTDGVTPLYIAWEVKRAKFTNDFQGSDVIFNTINSTSLRIASNTAHKQDNNVYEYKLSDLKIGGDIPTNSDTVTETNVDGTGFLMRELSIGLIYGVSMWLLIFIPVGFIVKNQKAREELEETT